MPSITLNFSNPLNVSLQQGTGDIVYYQDSLTNNIYTVENEPKWIVVDSNTYFEGAGYSYSAGTLTLDTKPVLFIRSIY